MGFVRLCLAIIVTAAHYDTARGLSPSHFDSHLPSLKERALNALRHQSILSGCVIACLLAGAFSVVIGTVLGITSFTDVGYPDSANLLRIGDVLRSGHLYPAFDRPPYLVTLYGPLFYVVLAVPYGLAQAAGITPELPVRLGVVGALCLSVLIIFGISRRLHGSRSVAWLCVLFGVSVFPMASWTTQIRPDFLALGFSLLSIYLCHLTNDSPRAVASAISAGSALLVKATFVAAPIAIVGWLIYRRRYKEAVVWITAFVLTAVGGYALAWWREPLMLQHIAALRHPIFEYRAALFYLWIALSQPVVPFAALGGFLALWKRSSEGLLLAVYCIVAWIVAILTAPQVGSNINYFWEPLLAAAALAGPGLSELQRKAKQAPLLVTPIVMIVILGSFLPTLWHESGFLRQVDRSVSEYQLRKVKWDAFVSAISGHKFLSTFPAVTFYSVNPELPDPFLNSVLERSGQWNSGPIVAQINEGAYELVIIGKGDDEIVRFRGISLWNKQMREAMKRAYRLACVFEEMEVWLPRRDSSVILPRLSAIGCLSASPDKNEPAA